jgi:tellurite resistance protein
MTFSEKFGPEVAGFIEAAAMIAAADDSLADSEMEVISAAIENPENSLFSALTEGDRVLVLQYVRSRALELVTSSFGVFDEDGEERLLALTMQSLEAISQASSLKDEILALANSVAASDGLVAQEEQAMLQCLDTCLTDGPAVAFRALFGIA